MSQFETSKQLAHNKILAATSMLSYLVIDEPQNYSQINRWARRVVELSEEILTEELEQEFQDVLAEGQELTQDG